MPYAVVTCSPAIVISNAYRFQNDHLKELQTVQTSVAPQVTFPQPVIFLDAFGNLAPFHLEWIDCWKAFMAVLKVRFQNAGLQKIERGEFALYNSTARSYIDFSRPFRHCFRSGHRIAMSIVFMDSSRKSFASCPSCKEQVQGNPEDEFEW